MAKTLDESVGLLLSAMGQMGSGSQGPMALAIGQVLVGSQEGLQVQCGGNVLTAADIWINEALLSMRPCWRDTAPNSSGPCPAPVRTVGPPLQ